MEEKKSKENLDACFKALAKCVKQGKKGLLQDLLNKSPIDISQAANNKGQTLLHLACKYNREEIAAFLIRRGFSIHKADEKNRCPVYTAVYNGHTELAEMLVQAARRAEEGPCSFRPARDC